MAKIVCRYITRRENAKHQTEQVVDEQKWPVRRVTFTSAALLEQVASFPQVVNLGPDGTGCVVEGGADAAAATPRPEATGSLPEAKRRKC